MTQPSSPPPPQVSARRVLFVADAGGHLMEAVELARSVFATAEQHWHTADTAMSRSLLEGRNVTFSSKRVVPASPVLAVREVFVALRALRRLPVDTVVSTGSAYALPWLTAARLLRKQAVFLESAARLSSLSRVGGLVGRVPGVRRATQAPLRVDGWEVWPNVLTTALQGFVSAHHQRLGPPRLLVTVGTFEFPFDRLIDRIERICPADWELVWQYGEARRPTRGDAQATRSYAEMATEMQAADVVVGHAGVGTVLAAAAAGAQMVLAPRLGSFGEHVDDHQVELVQVLGGFEAISPVADVDDITVELLQAHVDRARATG